MILKMQNGSPFKAVTFQDFSTPAKSGSSSPKKTTTEEKDEADVLELLKTFQKDLIDNALPGDFAYASNQLVRLFTRIENKLENPFLGTGSIASEYIQCIQLVSKLRQNKEDYKKALDTATSKGTLEEYAINSRGHVLVKTPEGITWKNPEQITQSDLLITNQDLLLLRREGAEGMSNSNNYSDIIMGSVGYNQIVETVNKTLQNLGSNKYTDGITAYQKAKEENPNASIEEMVNEGIISEDQANQAFQAMSYMWNNLPDNMKSILKINSGEYTEDGGFNELTKIVGSKTSKTITAKITKQGSSSVNDKTKKDYNDSLILKIQNGRGGYTSPFMIANKSNESITVTGDRYEQIKTPDGDHVGKTTIEKMLGDSGLRSIIISNHIYLGKTKIEPQNLDKIIYDGTGLLRAILPVDNTGKPVFEILEAFEEANNKVILEGNTNESRLKYFSQNEKLRRYINSDGSFNINVTKPFMLINSFTIGRYFDNFENNNFIVHKGYDEQLIQDFKNTTAIKKGNDIEYLDIDEDNWYELERFADQIYKGTLFIEINPNKNSAFSGNNQAVDINIANAQEDSYQRRNTKGIGDSKVLGNI